jgi:5-methylcytosine-specific restriction endonuclease McrA
MRVFRPNAVFPKRFEVVRETHLNGTYNAFRRKWLRMHPHCARCGLAGEEVHHIAPRAIAPHRIYDPTNLMTLCRACHRAEHANSPYGERPIEGV